MISLKEINNCGYLKYRNPNFHLLTIEQIREEFIGMVVGRYGFRSKAGVILDIEEHLSVRTWGTSKSYTATVLWNAGVAKAYREEEVPFGTLRDIVSLLEVMKADVKELQERIDKADTFNEP
jgi:hypothetical protein